MDMLSCRRRVPSNVICRRRGVIVLRSNKKSKIWYAHKLWFVVSWSCVGHVLVS